MNGFFQDFRYALRQLRKNPGFTAAVVITLAIGIGANTAIFSVLEAVLLRPLPYENPEQLALLTDFQDPENGGFLLKDVNLLRSEIRSFADIAIYYRNSGFSNVTITDTMEPESVQGAFVSSNLFSVMSMSPVVGRVFTSDEESRRERVVALSYGLWNRRFGASQGAIGKDLLIDGIPHRIVGVMPEIFQFPSRDQPFWAPITSNRYWGDPSLEKIDPSRSRYAYERWQAVGRLRPDVSLAQAQVEISTMFTRLLQADPKPNRGSGITVTPLHIILSANTRRGLTILSCAVCFVLLIACSNVANLVLVRGAGRVREIAVRTALGAGFSTVALGLAALGIMALMHYSVAQRTREIGIRSALGARRNDILRLVLLDAVRLAFFGIVIGVFGAMVVTRFMESLLFGVRPIDPVTFSAAPLLLIGVALLASYMPARRAAKVDPMVALRYE